MSRLKNFPKKVEIGLTKNNEFILLPEKVNWGLATQIKVVREYALTEPVADPEKKPRRKRKPKQDKTEPKPEQEPTESKAMWECKSCGKDVEEPFMTPNHVPQCPHCMSLKVEAKDI